MRDRQRTHGLGQQMNSENLNGWKCLDEKRMGWKNILSLVSARGPIWAYRGYWFFVKVIPCQLGVHGYHKS
jgi:hypothetical protein